MKKIISLFTTLCIVFSMLGTFTVFAEETAADLEISSLEDLKTFRDSVNGGNTYAGKTVTLTANLDLSSENWTPIGNSSYAFQGTFDGGFHTIYNLTINTTNRFCGLFGRLKNAGIKNLGIENANITSSANDAAALSGNAQGGTISRCYVTGTVKGKGAVSGILGSTHSSSYTTNIDNCYARIAIIENGTYTKDLAGISGWNESTSVHIENCYSACTGEIRPIAGWSDGSAVSNNKIVNTYFDKTLSPNFSTASGRADLGKTSDELKTQATYSWDFDTVWAISADKNGGYPYLRGFTPGLGGAPGSVSVTVKNSEGAAVDNAQVKIVPTAGGDETVLNHQGNGVYSGTVTTSGKEYDVYVNNEKQGTVTQTGNSAATQSVTVTASAEDEPLFESGTGTEEDPYLIPDLETLEKFRDSVNGGNTYEGKTVTLTEDINLGGSEENQWTPIGNYDNQFKGTFDGDNHQITGLYINSSSICQGLFGCVGVGGAVKNLGVDGTVTGENFVGGVVGYNNGTVTNCHNTGAVTGKSYVGGVVGGNYDNAQRGESNEDLADIKGSVENCYNAGTVSGSDYVGGVVGDNICTIRNSYNTGAVTGKSYVGGVVGTNYGTVTNCYHTGAVSGSNRVGGVAGYTEEGTATHCYYLNSCGASGGINGMDELGKAEVKTKAEFKTQSTFDSWDFVNVWTMSASLGRPILTANPEPTVFESGTGTEEDPYLIPDLETLERFRDSVNGGENYEGKFIKLTANIDLGGSEENQWTPIGKDTKQFKGTFDGDNHEITGLYINNSEGKCNGLFAYVGLYGTVKNLGVDGTVTGSGVFTVTGEIMDPDADNSVYAGGVAGCNSGTVTGCRSTVAVSGSSALTVTGEIMDFSRTRAIVDVGGVVGFNSGTVTGCSCGGTVTGSGTLTGGGDDACISVNVGGVVGFTFDPVTNCYNTGTVTGTGNDTRVSVDVGGVVGFTNGGTVTGCYNTGKISGSGDDTDVGGVIGGAVGSSAKLTSCYNTGAVSGGDYAGGVIGFTNGSPVTSCYNTGKISGSGKVGGVAGGTNGGAAVENCYYLNSCGASGSGASKTADEFKTQSTFDGWAFDTVWTMSAPHGRPILTAIPEPEPSHKHNVCNDESCADGHEDITWTAWTKTDSLPTDAGSYYLTKDVELSAEWNVPTGAVNLCLNGHSITQKTANAVTIKITSGATFNLCDCSENSDGTITHTEGIKGSGVYNYGGTFNMYGGSVTKNNTTINGGGVFNYGGTFNMYGGSVTGNTAGMGGGVYILGTFDMRGGEIKNNTAQNGGGVYMDANTNFNMYGGSITDNTATSSGGGVYILGTFNMHGGSVTDNTASHNGGGVYNYGTFNMDGGSVTKNNATEYGVGVYSLKTMKISGKPVITGNKKGSADNNVYLCQYYDGPAFDPINPVPPSSGSYKNRLITIDGALTEGAQIGVTTETAPTEGNPVNITDTNNADYSKYFTSDNSAYEIKNTAENVLQLAVRHTHTLTHHEAVAATCTEDGTGEYWKCEGDNGCGKMFSDADGTTEITTIPTTSKTGHAMTKTDAVAATCDTDGNDAYWTCSNCNKMFSDADGTTEITAIPTTSKTGHNWGAWTITKNPTSTETGTAKHICTKNNTHEETKDLPVLTDTSVWTAGTRVEPTEDTDGSQVYTSDYGTVTVTIPATGHTHNWGAWTITKNPTSTETGTAKHVCTKNNTHEETKDLPVLTDTSVWTAGTRVEPTEDTDGSQEYTSDYGTVTVTIPATGHTHEWGDWTVTKNPTSTETGTAKRVCTKNNTHEETKTIPALSDTSVWTAGTRVEPTEDTDGSQEYTSDYGTVTVTIPATGKPDVPVFDIDGTVVDKDSNRVADVKLSLKKGNTTVTTGETKLETVSNANGEFKFTNIPSGIYNLVAEYENNDETITVTSIVTVTDQNVNIAITLPDYMANSILKIKGNKTPDIIVGGLDKVASDNAQQSETVTITMTVESKEADSANAEQSAIKNVSVSKNIDYLDIKITKTVDSAQSDISETNNIITIVIPFDKTGKKNIKVYRYHGDSAAALSENTSDGEYFTVGDGIITVYANKFSTYAIGYDTEKTDLTPTPTPTTKPHHSGSSASSSYTVTFNANNGTKNTTVKASKNTAIKEPAAPIKGGYIFDGWYTDSKLTKKYDFSEKVTKSFTLYAKWTEAAQSTPEPTQEPVQTPETRQHKAYIVGYEGQFNPDGNITRAETAAILARLTDGFDENNSYTTSFADVDNNLWYHKYIGFEESQNIITGYEDGTFKPESSITRAEFANMIVRFTKLNAENSDTPFTDINGHWAQNQIAACYAAEYIKGYEDNIFMPDNYIIRAEAVAIINRVLGRDDIKDFENPFNDVTDSHWAYMDIIEASITHNVMD